MSAPGPSGRARLVPAAIASTVLVLLLLAAGRRSDWPVGPPPCFLRTVTGIPCPGCGGTRAFASLAQGDAARAFAHNPLVVAAAGLVAAWFLCALVSMRMSERACAAVRERVRGFGRGWLALVIAAVVAHWVYLIVFLE